MNDVTRSSSEPAPANQKSADHRRFIGGAWATGLGTLVSRILGLARDVATAALLGLGESGVMDALVIAVRIPNLFRRLFGEGALTAAFMPVFVAERERSLSEAWKLTSAVLVWLAGVLLIIVLVAEAFLGIVYLVASDNGVVTRLLGFVAASLPYVISICIASLIAAVLQSLGRFTVPALAPAVLNVCWLAGALFIAPYFAPDKVAQAWVLILCIQVAGLLQIGLQWPSLRAIGFRFHLDWGASRDATRKIGRTVAVVAFGLTITQINTLLDSLIAWFFSTEAGSQARVPWLNVEYPMRAGAASAIHYGERFYQLPLGLLGVAIATAIFPLLSRHAARGDKQQLGSDLTLALRVALFTSVPAGVGLVLIADPLAQLLYAHGTFTTEDAARTARMIVAYSSAVWAFCSVPVLVRGFYAHGNQLAPVRIGLITMACNVLLDFTLIWWIGEIGLAASTATAAVLQFVLLVAVFHWRYRTLDWSPLIWSAVRTVGATLVMGMVVSAVLAYSPAAGTWRSSAIQLVVAVFAGILVYWAIAVSCRSAELRLLVGFRRGKGDEEIP
jgi:putative peptidoglycan lipid II flippase